MYDIGDRVAAWHGEIVGEPAGGYVDIKFDSGKTETFIHISDLREAK